MADRMIISVGLGLFAVAAVAVGLQGTPNELVGFTFIGVVVLLAAGIGFLLYQAGFRKLQVPRELAQDLRPEKRRYYDQVPLRKGLRGLHLMMLITSVAVLLMLASSVLLVVQSRLDPTASDVVTQALFPVTVGLICAVVGLIYILLFRAYRSQRWPPELKDLLGPTDRLLYGIGALVFLVGATWGLWSGRMSYPAVALAVFILPLIMLVSRVEGRFFFLFIIQEVSRLRNWDLLKGTTVTGNPGEDSKDREAEEQKGRFRTMWSGMGRVQAAVAIAAAVGGLLVALFTVLDFIEGSPNRGFREAAGNTLLATAGVGIVVLFLSLGPLATLATRPFGFVKVWLNQRIYELLASDWSEETILSNVRRFDTVLRLPTQGKYDGFGEGVMLAAGGILALVGLNLAAKTTAITAALNGTAGGDLWIATVLVDIVATVILVGSIIQLTRSLDEERAALMFARESRRHGIDLVNYSIMVFSEIHAGSTDVSLIDDAPKEWGLVRQFAAYSKEIPLADKARLLRESLEGVLPHNMRYAALSSCAAAVAEYEGKAAGAAVFERHLADKPGDGRAWSLLGRFREVNGISGAEDAYKKGLKKGPVDAEMNALYGRFLLSAGRFDESEKQFRRGVRRDRTEPLASWGLGVLLEQRGDEGGAEYAFYRAIRYTPSHAPSHLSLAMLLSRRRDPRAEEFFHLAIGADPNSSIARHEYGNYLRREGLEEEAVHQYNQAVIQNENSIESWIALAEVSMELEQLSRAQTAYSQAVKLNEDNIDLRFALGKVSAARGHYQSAAREFGECRERGLDTPPLLEALGVAMHKGGLPERVEEVLGACLTLDEERSDAAVALAQHRKTRDDLEGAEAVLEKVVGVAPTHDIWYELGLIRSELGSIETAIASFEQASSLEDGARAHYQAGLLHLRGGNHAEALTKVRNALLHEPGNQAAWALATTLPEDVLEAEVDEDEEVGKLWARISARLEDENATAAEQAWKWALAFFPAAIRADPEEQGHPEFSADPEIRAGDDVKVLFAQPIPRWFDRHYWITLLPETAPDDDPGGSVELLPGESSVTLKAPRRHGHYQIRLHCRTPSSRYGVVHRDALLVTDRRQQAGVDFLRVGRFHFCEQDIRIRFAEEMRSPVDDRYWVVTAAAGMDDFEEKGRQFVPNRGEEVVLTGPELPGHYEIRLHDNWPARRYNVVQRIAVELVHEEESGLFHLQSDAFDVGSEIEIRFSKKIPSKPSDRCWITLVPKDEPDSKWGTWEWIPDLAEEMTLKAPATAGDYEIRVHKNYPRYEHRVWSRDEITVETVVGEEDTSYFTLEPSAVTSQEQFTVRFRNPVRVPPGERMWITIVNAGDADEEWGSWTWVDEGTEEMILRAPGRIGRMEVRLHDLYPKQSHHVIQRSHLAVEDIDGDEEEEAPVRFHVLDPEYHPGESISVLFERPVIPREREQLWITVVKKSDPDSEWGDWDWVNEGTKDMKLDVPSKAGEYEVRLHDRYPKESYHVAQRQEFTVHAHHEAQVFEIIGAEEIAGSEKFKVKFARPITNPPGDKKWITVTRSDHPDSAWGDWSWIPDGTTEIEMDSPGETGRYEVRFHDSYPKETSHCVQRVEFEIESGDRAEVFGTQTSEVDPGETIEVKFIRDISAPGDNKKWITITKGTDDDSTWGKWKWVPDGSSSIELVAPREAGDYQIRFHDNYPASKFHVVQRHKFKVLEGEVKPAAATPGFSIADSTIGPKDAIPVKFASAIASPSDDRKWITVCAITDSDSTWGDWSWVPDGASEMTLKGPSSPGDYEIRLHDDYPRQTFHVAHRAKFLVSGSPEPDEDEIPSVAVLPPRFEIQRAQFTPGEKIEISFESAVDSPGSDRKWITVCKSGDSESTWGDWSWVPDGAKRMVLDGPKAPGDYEVRLHDCYPAQSFHLVQKKSFVIEGVETTVPRVPTPGFQLPEKQVQTGEEFQVLFDGPIEASDLDKKWITVIAENEPDTGWGKWSWVKDGATDTTLTAPDDPGSYEVRLHDNYPDQSSNVVHRETVEIVSALAPPPEAAEDEEPEIEDSSFGIEIPAFEVGDPPLAVEDPIAESQEPALEFDEPPAEIEEPVEGLDDASLADLAVPAFAQIAEPDVGPEQPLVPEPEMLQDSEEIPEPPVEPDAGLTPEPETVLEGPQTFFGVDLGPHEPGDSIEVSFFAFPDLAEGEKMWITIVPDDAEDNDWGAWQWVKPGQETAVMKAAADDGVYEIRLHNNYPAEQFHVLQRIRVLVVSS